MDRWPRRLESRALGGGSQALPQYEIFSPHRFDAEEGSETKARSEVPLRSSSSAPRELLSEDQRAWVVFKQWPTCSDTGDEDGAMVGLPRLYASRWPPRRANPTRSHRQPAPPKAQTSAGCYTRREVIYELGQPCFMPISSTSRWPTIDARHDAVRRPLTATSEPAFIEMATRSAMTPMLFSCSPREVLGSGSRGVKRRASEREMLWPTPSTCAGFQCSASPLSPEAPCRGPRDRRSILPHVSTCTPCSSREIRDDPDADCLQSCC